MKIYTKTGDRGETGLYGGGRLPKDAPRIEAYGTVDELNAVLGLVRAQGLSPAIDALLARLQNELFDLGAELATLDPADKGTAAIRTASIEALEVEIDRFEATLPALRQFILPGGTPAAAALHLARTVCRRAERRVVTLSHQRAEQVSPQLTIYLNRLSDLLFVLARASNAEAGQRDIAWTKADAAAK